MDAKSREKAITRTSIIGIVANIFLAAFKAFAGLAAGSIAIVLDAVNNLTDAMSSVITIAGIKLAKRKPDKDHPYGHGRLEYFSTILIALLVGFAGVSSAIESAKKIFSPEIPDYTIVTVLIVVVSVITKLLLGRFVKTQGEKFNSDALKASGADASFDAVISASTLVGAVIAYLFRISVDGIIGAVISAFIIKAGVEMFMEAVGDVMGARPDSEITQEIKKTVAGIDGVLGAFDLILHDYGPDSAIGSIHVEVPAELTAREIHQLIVKIQRAVEKDFHIFMTVGIYAVDQQDSFRHTMRDYIIGVGKSHEGVISVHGVYIDEEKSLVSFDVGVDFTVPDRKQLAEQIRQEINEKYPEYRVIINFDTYYSD